jgi:competence protein ComGC
LNPAAAYSLNNDHEKIKMLHSVFGKGSFKRAKGIALIELLVVIVIGTILEALSLPGLNPAKAVARRTTCLNNLRRISPGMRLYCDDHADFPPGIPNTGSAPYAYWASYKELIKSYVGLNGVSSPADQLSMERELNFIACPES